MSKISIAGAATGTATFTIESPATSTNRTLTLPDNTGTIITQNSTPAFASTIGVGGATAAASGAGITFPATQSASSDANTLDDYEEGTWTGAIAPETGAFGSITYGAQAGSYTKVGNMVTIQINIYTTGITVGTASGTISITGLPFAEAGAGASGMAVEAGLFGDWVVAPISGYVSGTFINLTKRATSNSAASAKSNVTDLNTGAFNNYIIFSCTYLAA